MSLLLPRQAPASAGRRGADDLPRLRLTSTARRLALAVAAGALLYSAHPPFDLGAAGIVALIPLLLLARDLDASDRPARGGLGSGLLAGVVFFGPLLWWIFRFGVVAWTLLVVIQAVSVALFVAAVAWFGADRAGRGVFAVALWVALEAARGTWPFGGFGWGLLGASQHGGGVFLPIARTLGVLGVSAALAAVAVCLEEIGVRAARALPGALREADTPADSVFRAARTPLLTLIGVLVAAVLLSNEPPPASDRTLDIAAIQAAGIETTAAAGVSRVDPGRIVEVASLMADASGPLAADPPAVTVWPENALDADYTNPSNAELRAAVGRTLAILDGGSLLANSMLDGPRPRTLYNAMLEIGPDGEVVDRYIKRKPVPFGEYIPFRRWLDWFPPLRQIPNDVLGSAEPGVLTVAGARIGTVICYENAFPDLVHSQVDAGAELLVVATNNTAFGPTAMSRQHLALSQLRAVETGRWVLHSGISGVSGVVDPFGRITQQTQQFARAIVRADLPLVDGRTPATVIAPWLGWTAVIAATLALVARALRPTRQELLVSGTSVHPS
jgi:apolipoprotein N-acyltransferase